MIKIEHTEVYGLEPAIRGARNPMNSWDKSDSYLEYFDDVTEDETGTYINRTSCDYVIGPRDMALLEQLAKAGPDHGKFLRMIVCYCDITAPLYWWKEYDTYKIGTVANSCSTMHKIHEKKFERSDFSMEHLIPRMKELLDVTIANLNACRGIYLETKDKTWWWQMIQLLPTSYNQRRTVQLNYAAIRNMYHARKNHKLDEWRDFCAWIETLPYSELITDA